MNPLVIDASAAIDTLDDPDLAQHMVHHYDVCAPALLHWEIGNVVHAKHPDVFGDPEKRRAVVRALLAPVRLVDQTARADAVADIVDKTSLSYYDAAYLQLALDEGGGLVTHDKRLHAAAARKLGHPRVWTLAEAADARKRGKF